MAATIDTILNGILIASGVGSLSVALKKFGAKQLQHIFIRTIKKKVIGKAAIALGISLPSIAGFLNYVVDPAGKIAEYFDSKDKKPNNGYLDVIVIKDAQKIKTYFSYHSLLLPVTLYSIF